MCMQYECIHHYGPYYATYSIHYNTHTAPHTAYVASRTAYVASHTAYVPLHTAYVEPHTANVAPHTKYVASHTAYVASHTAYVALHTANVAPHTPNVAPHTATPTCRGIQQPHCIVHLVHLHARSIADGPSAHKVEQRTHTDTFQKCQMHQHIKPLREATWASTRHSLVAHTPASIFTLLVIAQFSNNSNTKVRRKGWHVRLGTARSGQ